MKRIIFLLSALFILCIGTNAQSGWDMLPGDLLTFDEDFTEKTLASGMDSYNNWFRIVVGDWEIQSKTGADSCFYLSDLQIGWGTARLDTRMVYTEDMKIYFDYKATGGIVVQIMGANQEECYINLPVAATWTDAYCNISDTMEYYGVEPYHYSHSDHIYITLHTPHATPKNNFTIDNFMFYNPELQRRSASYFDGEVPPFIVKHGSGDLDYSTKNLTTSGTGSMYLSDGTISLHNLEYSELEICGLWWYRLYFKVDDPEGHLQFGLYGEESNEITWNTSDTRTAVDTNWTAITYFNALEDVEDIASDSGWQQERYKIAARFVDTDGYIDGVWNYWRWDGPEIDGPATETVASANMPHFEGFGVLYGYDDYDWSCDDGNATVVAGGDGFNYVVYQFTTSGTKEITCMYDDDDSESYLGYHDYILVVE